MDRFEQTTIWQRTLAKQLEPDIYEKERDFLRIQYESFRSKAKLLASEIAQVLPDFTVHDISHIDALWETAELVLKENFNLTPTEAFVLGGAFLIHDLGMGLAAFPNGLNELKKEAIWTDIVSSLLKKKLNRPIKDKDILNVDKETEKIATENILRLLHAKHAKKLAMISWKDSDSKDLFLIENLDLRESYGSIIGQIAYSHWLTVSQLEDELPETLGAPGIFPSNWTIDPIKLACILRIADAIQIDDRRAPSFLKSIRKLSHDSSLHWNFQQKLYQPRLEKNRIVYTSKTSFTIEEVESWWLCYDTLKMIDRELQDVDSLLIDLNRDRLKAVGVASIEDPQRLSKLITVDKWHPIDTKIKVGNVAKLVNNLGGKQLYGENASVPLRELIQNASDAIRARRLLENESLDSGNIIIRQGKDDYGYFIEVEDNGIGMSKKVLTGPFLDFGESFWGTSLMHEEIPGLESKGFSSTGKYGIGFFSVFMWGERVSIATKRFETGRENTLMLEFTKGASSRPILRKATSGEVIKDGGTRVKVWFSNSDTIDILLRPEKFNGLNRKRKNLSELIETLCPTIDCNIYVEEKAKKTNIIKANDWITISPIDLMKRLIGRTNYDSLEDKEKQLLKVISKNMSVLKEKDGRIVGRAFIFKRRTFDEIVMQEGVVTVGGFKTSGLTGLIGIFVGQSCRASRDIGIPIVSDDILEDWATKQANLLFRLKLDVKKQEECSQVIRYCGGDTSKLKFAIYQKDMIGYDQVKQLIDANKDEDWIIVQDAAISNYERENSCKINLYPNVIGISGGVPGVLQTRTMNIHIDWPEYKDGWFHSKSLKGLVLQAFSESWKMDIKKILKNSQFSTDEKSYNAPIGSIDGKAIIMDYVSIIKRKK